MSWWPLGLYRVVGPSMLPTYADGDLLLGWRWFKPRTGQVVVARHERFLVKRIGAATSEGIWLIGDNPEFSTDSRTFGYLPTSALVAKVLFRLAG